MMARPSLELYDLYPGEEIRGFLGECLEPSCINSDHDAQKAIFSCDAFCNKKKFDIVRLIGKRFLDRVPHGTTTSTVLALQTYDRAEEVQYILFFDNSLTLSIDVEGDYCYFYAYRLTDNRPTPFFFLGCRNRRCSSLPALLFDIVKLYYVK